MRRQYERPDGKQALERPHRARKTSRDKAKVSTKPSVNALYPLINSRGDLRTFCSLDTVANLVGGMGLERFTTSVSARPPLGRCHRVESVED